MLSLINLPLDDVMEAYCSQSSRRERERERELLIRWNIAFSGKQIMHDPMAMRPFFGYNFGHYLQHWLNMKKPGRKVPLSSCAFIHSD